MDQDWWKGAVIYQIYPRSYCDSSGNGTGDLPGITSKIEYISSLGVDAIWLSPFQKSPMCDFGYDVSDYCDVDPLFGTLNDFDDLIHAAHQNDIKVIIDMVLSHSSDQHAWFTESRKDRTNPKADWYVWHDPREDGCPPNNWLSVFGGSAWQYCSHRGQYYLHNFLTAQPDLNLHNLEVQDALLNACEFWLKRGVDGFRLDAISHFFHSQNFEDNPAAEQHTRTNQLEHPDPYSMQKHKYDKDTTKIAPFLKRIRKLMDKYKARMTVGEVSEDDSLGAAARYTYGTDMLNTCYNFSHLGGQNKKLTVDLIADPIKKYNEISKHGWPAWAFCNHDVVRVASRWGQQNEGENNPEFSKMLIALLTSLQGTVFLYQGEELGLAEAELKFEELQDPWGIYLYPKWQGRDGCRTPMIWNNDAATNYGFSPKPVKSWLPVCEKHIGKDPESQNNNAQSVLNFTREFLKFRKKHPALITGHIEFIDSGSDTLLIFDRISADQTCRCIFNLKNSSQNFNGKNIAGFSYDISVF